MDPHIIALRRLILVGWTVNLIGDPRNPEMLIYTHETPGMEDALQVRAADDARATRRVAGRVTITVDGSVSDLVTTVLNWSRLAVIA